MASYYLSLLVPTTGLLFDYPLADVAAAGAITSVTDESGNARHLTAPGTQPNYELSSINGQPSVKVAVGDGPLVYATGFGQQKHIFLLAKYDLAANFGGSYRGLLSDNNAISVLVGDNAASSTKFTDMAFGGSYTYIKSQTGYAEANQQAPFSQFELLELAHTVGFSLTTLQLGQQTTFSARDWSGRWTDLKGYSAVLSAADLRKLRLYYDLKYHLFNLNSTTLYFPDPTTVGIHWRHFDEMPTDWDPVTADHTYEDEGKSFNTATDTPPVFWMIDYTGLSKAQTDIFDAFNDAARRDRTFSLIDKWGVTQTGLRIVRYSRDHQDHKSWDRTAAFTLAKYP